MARAGKNAPFLVLLLILLLPWTGRAEGAQIFGNPSDWDPPDRVSVSTADLFAAEPYTADWMSRSFFFVGRLDNGTFFVFNPFYWQYAGFRSWGLTVLVTDTGGRLFSFNGSLPLTRAEMTASGFDLQLGTNVFQMSGSGTYVHIQLEGFSCDLHITNILAAWKPGDGWAWYDAGKKAFSRYAVAAPWALVSGSVTVFGGSGETQGQCFVDTNYSVQPLEHPNSPAYVFRAFSEPGVPASDQVFIDMLSSTTSEHYGSVPLTMLLAAKGGVWLFTARDFALAPDDWASLDDPPFSYPRSYWVSASKSGYQLEGKFTATRLYHTTDVFRSIPPFLRPLVSIFVKRPVLFRMIGWFRGSLHSPDGSLQQLALPAHGEYILVK
ncbi:MAG: hypothetical protein ACLQDL_02225 [Spirochaetia bacterium]